MEGIEKSLKKIVVIFLVFVFLFFVLSSTVCAITSSAGVVYDGIDVSDWQGFIDYSAVKASGISIVYIKASQGNDFKDPYFEINYENARSNGLKVGFYHFLTATSTQEAEQEAKFFASVISGKISDCRLAMDYETFQGANIEKIQEIAQTFLQKVQQLTGKQMVIYSDLYNATHVFQTNLAKQYPLWIAYYGREEALVEQNSNWSNWIGWQYEDKGRIVGIGGYVDRDFYTEEILLEDNSQLPMVENSNGGKINTETIEYVVKRGDTLSQIAEKYGTTVQEIVILNKIQNANVIYPGERLKILTNSTVNGNETRKAGSIIYTVKPGDSLWQIAREYGVTVNQIVSLNQIQNPNLIYPGEKIRITGVSMPNSSQNQSLNVPNIYGIGVRTYVVKRGDNLWGIARRYETTVESLVQKNQIMNPNLIYPGQLLEV